MKLILGFSVLVATVWCTALPPTTSSSTTTTTLNERSPWEWWDGDELDQDLPERFTLSISSPEYDFKDYKFAVDWQRMSTVRLTLVDAFWLTPLPFISGQRSARQPVAGPSRLPRPQI